MTQPEQRIQIIRGDITTLAVDAIVNAANTSLMGGNGVDGAIHRVAGPELARYCQGLDGCRPGEAKLTPGFNLPARHVIHTVGPVWRNDQYGEAMTLTNCYLACLAIAQAKSFETIAFPAISTGIYKYPLDQATMIAVETCGDFLDASDYPQTVQFVCFTDEAEQAYRKFVDRRGRFS